jgi:MtrB/PioB family decaheme-associated outer membrane protein
MRIEARLFVSCAAGALLFVAGARSPALAADVPLVATEPVPYWWIHGDVEVGGRAFLNDPQRDGATFQGGKSLAKYYEYSTIKPGPFLNAFVLTGSRDGLYEADVWAKNVGYSDQSYLVDLSKAGQQYLTGGWDQTPHVYSTSALTIYNGIGSNVLTLPAGLSALLFNDAGCVGHVPNPPTGCGTPISSAGAAKVQQDILNNLHHTDIKILRDTGFFEYRATPTSDWDFRINYSNMHRSGTQIEGVVFSPSTSGVRVDAPKPVSDTTHNYSASGEYAGTSLWGQKYNFRLGYAGSTFVNEWNSYTVQNPFCPTDADSAPACARAGGNPPNGLSAPLALMSLWPDNQANMVSGTLGADLPFKSRYMATVAYNMMRQNEDFLPFTITAFPPTGFPLGWVGNTVAPVNSTADLPARSLNGAINTLLINNVMTTQITPDLKTKLSYRYFNFDNNTPEILFKDWVLTDTVSAHNRNPGFAPVQSLSISYIKQNAAAQVDWRPYKQVNLGAAYGWERYDWTRADVDVTNEHSVKVFGDIRPGSWGLFRGSWEFSERRFETYDYLGFVGLAQWPTFDAAPRYAAAYRQFLLDDRDRNKGKFLYDFDLIPSVVITPSFGVRWDDYHINPTVEEGLISDHAWNVGIDVSFVPITRLTLLASYVLERQNQRIRAGDLGPPTNPASANTTDVNDTVHTVMLAANWEAIPNTLDLKLSYTLSWTRDTQPQFFDNGTEPAAATGGQFPDVRNTWHRLEGLAKYKFDEDWVHRMGWKGDVIVSLRYAWERNHMTNWQIDPIAPYLGPVPGSPFCGAALGGANQCGYMVWIPWDNPNYNVHMIAGSVAFKW